MPVGVREILVRIGAIFTRLVMENNRLFLLYS